MNNNMQRYLDIFFVSENELTDILGINTKALRKAIELGCLPSWSYRVENEIVESYIFGCHTATNCRDGNYYSPAVVEWFNRSMRSSILDSVTENTNSLFRDQFITEYIIAAKSHNRFSILYQQALEDPEGMASLAKNTWLHHTKGTYGVCIQHPSTLNDIIEKQVVISELSALTNGGKRSYYSSQEINRIKEVIREYNRIVMPFSPTDYHLSSRAQLVDRVLSIIDKNA